MNSLPSLAHRGQLGWGGISRWQALSPTGQSWISEDLTIWCFLTQPQLLVCSTCPKPQFQGLLGHQRTPGYDRASSEVFSSGTSADKSRWPEHPTSCSESRPFPCPVPQGEITGLGARIVLLLRSRYFLGNTK